ncbi:MAG: hypothetical protein GF350_04365 [Chitinivibrionales bacterium]|nr:hypothetical protein [Chitinivibrionales bacterium]
MKAGRTTPGDLVLVSGDDTEVLLDNSSCYGAAFSPDAGRVVYVRNDDIYVVGSDGANPHQIKSGGMINNGEEAQTLSWCTNGYIYYSRDWDIYRVKDDGSGSPQKVHTSAFSNLGDQIRQLQVCRDGSRRARGEGRSVRTVIMTDM